MGKKIILPTSQLCVWLQAKSEPNQGSGDTDTALNDIVLHCRKANSKNVTDSISGSDPRPRTQDQGSFSSDKFCSGLDNPVVGFVVKNERKQFIWDEALNDIKLVCRNDEEISAEVKTDWGDWKYKRMCTTGSVVMGIITQVEQWQEGRSDDPALIGIKMFCMPYPFGWPGNR